MTWRNWLKTARHKHSNLLPLSLMLSLILRRAIFRTGILPAPRLLPTRAVLFSACPSWTVQRNLTTATNDGNSGSTAGSEPEPEAKSKPKSTRGKKISSTKAAGKDEAKKPKGMYPPLRPSYPRYGVHDPLSQSSLSGPRTSHPSLPALLIPCGWLNGFPLSPRSTASSLPRAL